MFEEPLETENGLARMEKRGGLTALTVVVGLVLLGLFALASLGGCNGVTLIPGNEKLQRMLDGGHLPDPVRGAIHPVDVRPANERPGNDGYSFRPDRLNQELDLSGYQPDLRAALAAQLESFGYRISEDGRSAVPQTPSAPPTASRACQPLVSVLKAAPQRVGRPGRPAERLARPVSHLALPSRQVAAVPVGRPASPTVSNRRAA